MGRNARLLLPLLLLLLHTTACKNGIEQQLNYLEKALKLEQEKLDRIWPGYNFSDYAIALYNNEESYIVNHPSPGPQFTDTGRTIAGMTLHYSPERVAEFNANTSISYNDKTTAVFRVNPGMRAGTFYGLLFHEVFHCYADSVPGILKRAGNLLLQPFFPAHDPEYYALALIEQQLLQDAVNAPRDSEAAELFRNYIAVNEIRTSRTDSSFAVYESEEQINEGIAEYAGNRGLELMGYQRTAAENFRVTIEKRIEEPTGFRLRTYGTGCAMAMLLDRFYPDWKTDLTLEKTLDGMLSEKMPTAETVNVAPLLNQYNVGSYMTVFENTLREYAEKQNQLRSEITTLPNIRLRFPDPEFANIYFDPMNITSAGDGLLYHSRYLKLFNKKSEFELELRGRKAITEFESGNFFLINSVLFTIPPNYALQIDGSTTLPEIDSKFKELEMSAEGFSLKMLSGELKLANGNLEIVLFARNTYSRNKKSKILLASTLKSGFYGPVCTSFQSNSTNRIME